MCPTTTPQQRATPVEQVALPPWTLLTFPFAPDVVTGRVPIESLCALARTRGVVGLDLFALEVAVYGEQRLLAALRHNRLVLSTLIVTVPFLAPSKKIEKILRRAIRLADRFGTKRIMIVPRDATTNRKQLQLATPEAKHEHYVRGFTLAVELATPSGIEILLEDTPTIDSALSTAADCRALLDRVPGLGLVYDTSNMLPGGDDPIEFFHAVKDRIRYVHFKDARLTSAGRGDRTLDGRVMSACVWGAGTIPLPEILRLLQQQRYEGPVAIEYVRPDGRPSLASHAAQLDRFLHAARAMRDPDLHEIPSLDARPFRWAYIGTGAIAKATSRKILATGRHEIATVYSRTVQKNEAFAREVGAEPARSLEEAITDEAVDGVYIASPATSHSELAKAAILLGKPVLLEKPFTVTGSDASSLFALAHERNVYLTEAMWTWFSPVARRVKAWIDDGAIGDVEDARMTIGFPLLPLVPRLKDPDLAGGGLLDLGIYATTYAHNLFGVPDEIEAVGRIRDGIDTTAQVVLRYASGPVVTVRSSVTRMLGERIVIRGSRGRIDVPFFHAATSATLTPNHGRRVRFRGNGGYDTQFDVVAQEIRAGALVSALVPPQATIENLAIIDECRRQLGLRYPFEVAGAATWDGGQ